MAFSHTHLFVILALGTGILSLGQAYPGRVAERIKRSDDGDPSLAVMQQIAQRVGVLEARLDALKAKQDNEDTTVAFYAWVNSDPLQTTPHGTLIINHATTNLGHGYDTHSGIFIAPKPGLYFFQASFLPTPSGVPKHAAIYVDDMAMATGISNHKVDQVTINTIVHLQSGQRVTLRNTESTSGSFIGYPSGPYTTFSGFLINAD